MQYPARLVFVALVALGYMISLAAGMAEGEYVWHEEECPDRFDVRANVMLPRKDSKIDVVLHFRDARNYLALFIADGKATARRVTNGLVTTLWAPRALPQSGSVSLLVKRRTDRITLIANGVLVGRTEKCSASRGRLGIRSTGGARVEGLRLQEVTTLYFADDFMRSENETGAWESISGKWRSKSLDTVNPDVTRSANPFSYEAMAQGRALAVAGHWYWDNYVVRVSVRPDAPGFVGVVVFYQDPRNYVIFRWLSRDRSPVKARQFVCVRDGLETVLAATGSGYTPGQWYRLAVTATDTMLRGAIDNEEVLSLSSPPFCSGKIGLYAEECATVSFDDALCTQWESQADDLSPFPVAPRIMAQFTQEASMQNWTSPDYDWRKGEDDWWWHRGEFWGDASIVANLPCPEGVASTAAFVIHAERGKPESGYQLATESSADGSTLSYRLSRQGKLVEQGKVTISEWPVAIRFQRYHDAMQVDIAGDRVLTVPEPRPLSGTGTGLKTTGRRIAAQHIYTTGTNCVDDTFATAPVDWWQSSGVWSVTNRWQCDPRWSWMAGWRSVAPVLWLKRAFGGDFTVEAYLCNKMELAGPPGYTHPGDLNITVCGNGHELASGYNFIYAGWNNTASGAFRKGKECALRNSSAVLLDASNRNIEFHRKWFVVHIERRGNQFRHWVDGELVSEFTDHNPIPSGRLALWTLGNGELTNGIVVARVRIWYQREAKADPFPLPQTMGEEGEPGKNLPAPVSSDATCVKHDFETDLSGWSGYNRREGARVALDSTTAASGKHCLRIESAGVVSDFCVWSGIGSFDAMRLGKLRFAYNIAPNVKVNMYLENNGRYHAVEFTGGPQPPRTCPTLGRIENVVADNQWHTAEFDIAEHVRNLFTGINTFPVTRICFSAVRETYCRVGIGGNGPGAKWYLDDFEISR